MGTVSNPFTNSKKIDNPSLVASAKLLDARVKFKDCREAMKMIKGMPIARAQKYLLNVIERKEIVTPPSSKMAEVVMQWPNNSTKPLVSGRKKSAKHCSNFWLTQKTMQSKKNLNVDKLIVENIQANMAHKIFKRTYMAHGRIAPFQQSPAHLFITLTEVQPKVLVPAL